MPQSIVNALALKLGKEIGEDGVTTTPVVTQIEQEISEIWRDFSNRADWWFLKNLSDTFSSSIGTSIYSLATSTGQILKIYETNTPTRVLSFISFRELKDNKVDTTTSGTPNYWYDAGFDESTEKNKIGLYPVPSAIVAYTVAVNKRGVELATTDVIPIPDDYLQIIENGTRKMMYAVNGEMELAQMYSQEYERSIMTVINRNDTPDYRPHLRTTDLPMGRNLVGPIFDPNHYPNN